MYVFFPYIYFLYGNLPYKLYRNKFSGNYGRNSCRERKAFERKTKGKTGETGTDSRRTIVAKNGVAAFGIAQHFYTTALA